MSSGQLGSESGATDQSGNPWPFAHMPWIPLIDEQGKPQKIPARTEWQLTYPGQWQVSDWIRDESIPDDDIENDPTGLKIVFVPGRGQWKPGWEEGWVSNKQTGLWPVDVDNPSLFEARIIEACIAIPRTRNQSTGREGGGFHLLFDGRNLPEEFWRQGGLGNPPWGDLKANGWIAAEGAQHPLGPIYTRDPDWPADIIEPPPDFAEWIMSEREQWREWLQEQSKAGKSGATGHRNVACTSGENRNIRLCALRGILFNKVPEMDDDEIREALLAANEEFDEPMLMREMEATVLKPKPGWVRHISRRHLPHPLTNPESPWLRRDAEKSFTGLDENGKVQLNADKDSDDDPGDVLRLSWAIALGLVSPHIATLNSQLVVVSGAERGALDISELTVRRLRMLCAENDVCWKWAEKKGEEPEKRSLLPSSQACGTVLSNPAVRLYRPTLNGITSVPVLRPEPGVSLLEVQGVDAATSMIYWPTLPIGTIPAAPDRSEVAAAKKLIIGELLHDFPWSSAADKANCLAMWLTSYLEPYRGFLSPLFVLDASKASSGKSFLVTVMVETTGAYFRSWVNVEEEIRKSLTACLMKNDPVVILDDVAKSDTVSSATLASMLTKRQWDDRILGVSKNFRGTNNRTWCLTGNNVKLGGDIPSRSVLIHLDPGPSDPKQRDVSSFKLGDISTWITQDQNKVRVIRALLTLITDWVAHGCPRSTVQHRFAEWAAIVGGVLEHHKVYGFLANQAKVEQHVSYDEHLGDFYRRWHELYGSEPRGVKKLRDALGRDAEEGDLRLWKGTWPRGRKNELLSWRALASDLRDALAQDHGGYQVDAVSDGHGGELFKVSPVVTQGE